MSRTPRAMHADTGAVLGPVPVSRMARCGHCSDAAGFGEVLVAAAKAVRVRRTAHKEEGLLRVRVDPAVV